MSEVRLYPLSPPSDYSAGHSKDCSLTDCALQEYSGIRIVHFRNTDCALQEYGPRLTPHVPRASECECDPPKGVQLFPSKYGHIIIGCEAGPLVQISVHARLNVCV